MANKKCESIVTEKMSFGCDRYHICGKKVKYILKFSKGKFLSVCGTHKNKFERKDGKILIEAIE